MLNALQQRPHPAYHLWPRSTPPDCWYAFNLELDRDAQRLPNEATIQQRLDELLEMPGYHCQVFWLTIGRLTEMTLKLAGDYADDCEFQAAGDLLVNPRHIDVHRRGHSFPITKKRHSGLSDQFAADIGQAARVDWLMCETHLCIREDALLPWFREALSAGGFVHADYLADLDRRMCRVANTIAFLLSWQINDRNDLVSRLAVADTQNKTHVQANLCCFDYTRFHAMGKDIEKFITIHGEGSRFLN